MKLSIISLDYIFPEEAGILCHFFEKGVEYIIIHKPQNIERDIIQLINEIPQKYHSRIIIHERFGLLKHFNLNGILLSKKNPKAPTLDKIFSKSVPCSRIDDIMKYQNFHHIFFGPVFESISKEIKPTFGETALREAKGKNIINEKVIAMGGISEETIPIAKSIGFENVAVLGSLWKNYPTDNNKQALLERFDKLIGLMKN